MATPISSAAANPAAPMRPTGTEATAGTNANDNGGPLGTPTMADKTNTMKDSSQKATAEPSTPSKDGSTVPSVKLSSATSSSTKPTAGESSIQDVAMLDVASSSNAAAVELEQQVVEPDSTRRSKRRSASRSRTSTNTSSNGTPATKKAKTMSSEEKQKSRVSKKEQELLDMVWICVACREAECAMDSESELLVCEGPCRRLYHITCAGLAQLPPEGVTWKCHDCQHEKHVCGFCQEYGLDQEDVFKCQKEECGHFFHEACLEMQNIPIQARPATVADQMDTAAAMNITDDTPGSPGGVLMAEPPKVLNFTCPAHWCWTCTQEDTTNDTAAGDGTSKAKPKGRRRKKSATSSFATKTEKRLFPCLDCPISYHLTCIPPAAKFHELALLCHEHAEAKELPALNVESSMQGSVEAAADQKLQKMQNHDNLLAKRALAQRAVYNARGVSSRNPFFPAGVVAGRRTNKEQLVLSKIADKGIPNSTATTTTEGDEGIDVNAATNMIIADGNQSDRLLFCLPVDVQEEVHSKPPAYKHIHSLKYYPENRPKKIMTPTDVCNCVDSCDDHCINRLLYVECFGNKGAAAADGSKRGTNCRLGPNCGNRRLGQRKHVKKCKPQTEKGKGWGLVTMEHAKMGTLVQEYLGDVIDEKTKEQRLKEWSVEHPNDPNFYVMCLAGGWYIDARETANLSRFINHSCDPNCILLRLNVGGYMRDGIFALRDIQPGEFLSYDYHFDTKLGDKFICRCGSSNCRGTMMEKNLKKDAVKKTKSELWSEVKQQFEKDKEFLEEFEAREKRNAAVQAVLPGATKGVLPTGSMTSKESARRRDGEGTAKKQEWVATGVQDKDRTAVLGGRPFLWRNAVVGSDFASRWNRFTAAAERNTTNSQQGLVRKSSSRKKPTAPLQSTQTVDVISVLLSNKKA